MVFLSQIKKSRRRKMPGRLQIGTYPVASMVRILVELRMTNRLHIFQKNLSYHQEQKKLIEKQDGLS